MRHQEAHGDIGCIRAFRDRPGLNVLCVSVVIDANIANGRDIRNLDSNIKSLRQKLTRHQAPQGGVQVFLGNADKRIAAQSGQQPRNYRLGTPGRVLGEQRLYNHAAQHGLHGLDRKRALLAVALDVLSTSSKAAAIERHLAEIMRIDRQRAAELISVLREREGSHAHARGIGHERPSFDIVNGGIAIGGRRDIVGMHVPGEHRRDARFGIRLRYALIIVDKVFAEDDRLVTEMRHDAVMLHGHHDITCGTSLFCLLAYPLKQIVGNMAARFLRERSIASVHIVFAGIHSNEREPRARCAT